MDYHSKKYLKETLFQAKRFGLSPDYIKQLEAKHHQQFENMKR